MPTQSHSRSSTASVAIRANTQPIVAKTFGTLALLVAIAGCTAPVPWTASSSHEGRSAVSSHSCPHLAGTYVNAAETDSASSSIDAKACGSLTFYFFSAHVPEGAGVSNYPTPSDDWPAGTHVQVEQPTADVLRIISLDKSKAGETKILASKDLDRKNGDFECVGNTIRLRPRTQRDFQLWMGRRTNTEFLEVSSDEDALVVQSTRQYASYLLWLVGGTMREEQSRHRWKRVK
jgi:hypothetical protein